MRMGIQISCMRRVFSYLWAVAGVGCWSLLLDGVSVTLVLLYLMPPYNISGVETTKDPLEKMADSGLPPNSSEQRLVNYEIRPVTPPEIMHMVPPSITKTQIVTVIVLCYVNLINYMDRFTVAGESSL